MSLKRRIAFFLALMFSVLFGTCLSLIYVSFAHFRQEEFQERLEQKAITTAKILLEIDEINPGILKRIDANSVDKLYSEHTLIYDQNYQLVYNSKQSIIPDWDEKELLRLKKLKKQVIRSQSGRDIQAVYYDFNKEDYFVIISAYDIHGISKLEFLLYSLLIVFISAIVIIWLATYLLVRKLVKPLDEFQEHITRISVDELHVQLEDAGASKEIHLLTRAFNRLLLRLEQSFASQREFTAHASHELRTPVTRIAFQLENLEKKELDAATRSTVKRMQADIYQLSELLNSLLLLARVGSIDEEKLFRSVRVDEVLFTSFGQMKKQYPDFDLSFQIETQAAEMTMEVKGVANLLEIAFLNLLRNAAAYSDNMRADVTIRQTETHLTMRFSNSGELLAKDESERVFQAFTRMKNAQGKNGLGLGLVIVKRILDYHKATIRYQINAEEANEFILQFPLSEPQSIP